MGSARQSGAHQSMGRVVEQCRVLSGYFAVLTPALVLAGYFAAGTHTGPRGLCIGRPGVSRILAAVVSRSAAQCASLRGPLLCGVSTGTVQRPSAHRSSKGARPSVLRETQQPQRVLARCTVCACAAPTPFPTNLGDTNPPTRAPTLSPTVSGGACHAHSTRIPRAFRAHSSRIPRAC